MVLNQVIQGDCLEKLKELEDNSVDSIVTDPPYELGFMGKYWDATGITNNTALWKQCYRVLKPGGHLLSFGGTRTYHRMACAIEDAGFEIRDMIEWVYGSGFPKSLNIGKKLGDKWEGWGTALKPAHEPICMARKPLSEKTVAENVLKWGTGGINIDESRVGTEDLIQCQTGHKGQPFLPREHRFTPREYQSRGRFPANLIHDNSEEVRECFPETKTGSIKPYKFNIKDGLNFSQGLKEHTNSHNGDSGNASRFFKSIKTDHEVESEFGGGHEGGRFPANLIHDNSEEVRECFPETKTGRAIRSKLSVSHFGQEATPLEDLGYDDNGGNASRFFKSVKIGIMCKHCGIENKNDYCYCDICGKRSEKMQKLVDSVENKPTEENKYNEYCCDKCKKISICSKPTTYSNCPCGNNFKSIIYTAKASKSERGKDNRHPTVKPIALMEYLIKMVTPKGGTVLDPFAGSGSTLVAAKQNGYGYIGIEKEEEYIKICEARLSGVIQQTLL